MLRRARVGLIAAILTVGSVAHANGRAPVTNGVHFEPGDSHSIFVATTFGLLISHDDGCSFRWVCEQAIGYGGTFDPKYAVASDGTLFAATYQGLAVSRDGGCTWNVATAAGAGSGASLAGVWIESIDIGATGEVWIGTADSGHPNDVYRSTDDGVTFVGRGMLSPTVWWKSVKVAPSDPMRVYLAGYQVAGTLADGGQMPPTAHLLHTSDDGETWLETPLTGLALGTTPLVHVMAVDPANADVIYVSSDGAAPPNGDVLYRSADAGATLTAVLTTVNPIKDVVVRDAHTVDVATSSGGAESTDGGLTFAPIAGAPQLACLGQRGDGALFGCGANWEPDYLAVGRAAAGSSAFSKVFRFVNLDGPLACAAGTIQHDTCAVQLWPGLQQQFASTGPTCGVDASDAGVDASPAPTPKASGGCCSGAGDGGDVGSLAWGGLLVGWLARRRRP